MADFALHCKSVIETVTRLADRAAMIRRFTATFATALLLAGCATAPRAASIPVAVQILAFNDYHGNLEPPRQAVSAPAPDGGTVRVPAGGVAYLASAVAARQATNPNHIVVAAGDIIGASPLPSGLFLDEPSIEALNLVGLDLSALGNHEFDKGRQELLRMQNGGCAKFTTRTPCQLDPAFPGAKFGFLAANTIGPDGKTLFPPYAIRTFGKGASRVRVGFIGLTLTEAATLVTPAGLAGLRFTDEAAAANALVPELKRQGADAIVVLIHQGSQTDVGYNDKSCAGLKGDILPVLAKFDPAIDVVVSGHTHRSYICDYGTIDPARPFLLTSAGLYGTLLTEITLTIDPRTHRVVSRKADNLIVQSEAYTSSTGEVPLTDLYPRYAKAAAPAAIVEQAVAAARANAGRRIGQLSSPAARAHNEAYESVLGDLVADVYLAATRGPQSGNARIAFTNPGGLRADLVPAADGTLTFGQIFSSQPFGNTLLVKSLTGRQILDVLEQQFTGKHSVSDPYVLLPSENFRYAFDLSRPAGSRIVSATVDGAPLAEGAIYRVTMNDFLASGGDGFSLFQSGTDPVGGPVDLDAMEAYFAGGKVVRPPATDRITNRTPG